MNSATSTQPALFINGASSNTISNSYFRSGSADGGSINSSHYNAISYSTMSSNGSSLTTAALRLVNASSNTLTDFVSNPTFRATGIKLEQGSSNNRFERAIANGNFASDALLIAGSSYNVVTQSYFDNTGSGNTVDIDAESSGNSLTDSNFTTTGSNNTVEIYGSYNDITRSTVTNVSGGHAVYLLNAARFNIVRQSTLSVTGANYFVLKLNLTSSNTISGNYIQASTAVWISAPRTILTSNVLVATNTFGACGIPGVNRQWLQADQAVGAVSSWWRKSRLDHGDEQHHRLGARYGILAANQRELFGSSNTIGPRLRRSTTPTDSISTP